MTNYIYPEVYEQCPHCDNMNEYHNITPDKSGYIVKCSECGKQIFLCSACMMAEDNTDGFCDWHIARQNDKYVMGKCFRGVTINRRVESI